MRRLLAIAAAIVAFSTPAAAYLHFTVNDSGQAVAFKWQRMPIRWFAKDRGAPGVPASDLQAAMSRAFATWQAVPTAELSFEPAPAPSSAGSLPPQAIAAREIHIADPTSIPRDVILILLLAPSAGGVPFEM